MSYATRGNSCNCSTNALTSNAKYIPPLSSVYYDPWTDMLMYPGYTGFTYPFQHPFGPDILKAWNLDTHSDHKPGRRVVYYSNDTGKSHTSKEQKVKKKHISHHAPIQQNEKHGPTWD